MTGHKKIRFSMVFLSLIALGLIGYTLCFPVRAMENIRHTLGIFTVSVLPSLAVFSVCTKILVKMGWVGRLAGLPLLGWLRLFGVSAGGFAAFLFGAFAGFPTGASILAELCENGEISAEEAASLLPFCNQAGVSFVVGTVGALVFGDARYGWLLFFAQTAAALTGLFLTGFARKNIRSPMAAVRKEISAFSAVTSAISETAVSMVCVCGFIVFFALCADAALSLRLVLSFPLPQWLSIALGGFLEISSGMTALAAARLSLRCSLTFAGALLGFGGFCVFLQAIDRTERFFYSPGRYFFGKLLETLLCPLFVLLLFTLI